MTIARTLGSLLLTFGLALLPSTVFGYAGDVRGVAVDGPNPCVGEPLHVTVNGDETTTEVHLVAEHTDGTTEGWTADAVDGVAEFTIRLFKEGTWTLTGSDQAGEVLGESMVAVCEAGAGDEVLGVDEEVAVTGVGLLPAAGASALSTLVLGVGLLALVTGTVLLYLRRPLDRRRAS